jgi:hypothetical protein
MSFAFGGFGAFFAQRGAGFLWQMRDGAFPFRGGSGFFDVPPGGGSLFGGGHMSIFVTRSGAL